MKKTSVERLTLSRRRFIVGTAAAGGGLALGIPLSFGWNAGAGEGRLRHRR